MLKDTQGWDGLGDGLARLLAAGQAGNCPGSRDQEMEGTSVPQSLARRPWKFLTAEQHSPIKEGRSNPRTSRLSKRTFRFGRFLLSARRHPTWGRLAGLCAPRAVWVGATGVSAGEGLPDLEPQHVCLRSQTHVCLWLCPSHGNSTGGTFTPGMKTFHSDTDTDFAALPFPDKVGQTVIELPGDAT